MLRVQCSSHYCALQCPVTCCQCELQVDSNSTWTRTLLPLTCVHMYQQHWSRFCTRSCQLPSIDGDASSKMVNPNLACQRWWPCLHLLHCSKPCHHSWLVSLRSLFPSIPDQQFVAADHEVHHVVWMVPWRPKIWCKPHLQQSVLRLESCWSPRAAEGACLVSSALLFMTADGYPSMLCSGSIVESFMSHTQMV